MSLDTKFHILIFLSLFDQKGKQKILFIVNDSGITKFFSYHEMQLQKKQGNLI